MIKSSKINYRRPEWKEFTTKIKERDNFSCLKCGRKENEATLQVHHQKYISGLKPWEYALSDCITLCKGCHAREHDLIEPEFGWTLVSIEDLGSLDGICERKGCNNSIRYEHITYYPGWGYKSVGSTCVEHLTSEDKILSAKALQIIKSISSFVHESKWANGITKKGKSFIETTHKHHKIRIYGSLNRFSYQIITKNLGEKWYYYSDFYSVPNKDLLRVKELSFIALKEILSNKIQEKKLLRELYECYKS